MKFYVLRDRPALSCGWCGEYLSTANVDDVPHLMDDELVCDVCAADAVDQGV